MPEVGSQAAQSPELGVFLDRHYRACLAALCIVFLPLAVMMAWPKIVGFDFSDPDDIMRLMEVRAWLGGQSWFDVTQYRINPPGGYAMHWSRFVDLPLAAIILPLKPWLGQRLAETVACIVVPALTLITVLLLISGITRRLFGAGVGLLAALFCLVNVATASVMRPMRIDHHGWEAAAGLGIMFFVLRRRNARDAILAGSCAACWTHVSLEGLAFTVGTAAWLGVRWLWLADRDRRLPAFLAGLAVVSLILFLATHRPALMSQTFCDAISPVHIGVFALAATLTAGAAFFRPMSFILRLATLASVAAACAALYALWAPQCIKGPFAALTPLVYRMWYLNIAEGLPLWQSSAGEAATYLICPLIGLIGSVVAFRRARTDEDRSRLIDYAILLLLATGIGVLVLRAIILANLLALPGQAALVGGLVRSMEGWSVVARVLGRSAAILLLSPIGSQAIVASAKHSEPPSAVERINDRCFRVDNYGPLNRIAPAVFMTPLDIGPSLVAGSHHDAVGGNYHRNVAAIDDVLRFFGSSDAGARPIAGRHAVRYVAYCSGDGMISQMSRTYPGSLAAHLRRGNPPAWLRPFKVPGTTGLHLYAVGR